MEKGHCSVEGCEATPAGRGWCVKHYARWRKHGDPEYTNPVRAKSKEVRLWSRVDKTDTCWNWLGNTNNSGYGTFEYYSKPIAVHRLSYEMLKGNIPSNMVVDHLCYNRLCVNPDHLRIVTPKQNRENCSGLPSTNNSGFLGVSWNKEKRRWKSGIRHNDVNHHLGYFPLYELHVAGYLAMMKRLELFTHNEVDRGYFE